MRFRDYEEFIASLNRSGAEFLIVGALDTIDRPKLRHHHQYGATLPGSCLTAGSLRLQRL